MNQYDAFFWDGRSPNYYSKIEINAPNMPQAIAYVFAEFPELLRKATHVEIMLKST